MDPDLLDRYTRCLMSPPPLLGPRRQRQAVAALARDGSVEAVRALARAAAAANGTPPPPGLLAALGQVPDRSGVDVICEVWAATRAPALDGLLEERRWVATAPVPLRVLTALKAGRSEVVAHAGPEVLDPLLRAGDDSDQTVAHAARECLGQLRSPELIDALAARWAAQRESQATEAIVRGGYVARAPAAVRALTALKCGRLDLFPEEPQLLEPLAAACEDAEADIAARARQAFGRLASPSTREAACRLLMEGEYPAACALAVQAGYAPREPHLRALFFFLTGQWEQYETLDFDQTLLRAAYETGDHPVRRRIAARARAAGRVEWVAVVAGGRRARRVGEMSTDEWAAALAVLSEAGRWEELWRLAQEAPALRSAPLLLGLRDSPWRPPEPDREGFDRLVRLAEAWEADEHGPAGLVSLAATLHGEWVSPHDLDPGGDGHPLASFAVSPNGEVLARRSRHEDVVRLWSLPDGRALGAAEGHRGGVNAILTGPGGGMLASGGDDGSVRLHSVPAAERIAVLEGHTRAVRALAISPNGRMLASGSEDGTVRLWTVPQGWLWKVLEGHAGGAAALAFYADGQRLAVGEAGGSVRFWDAAFGKELAVHPGPAAVHHFVVSPDGRQLASGAADGTVRLWNLDTEQPGATLAGHTGAVTGLAIDPEGRLLASASRDGTVRLRMLPEGRLLKVLEGHADRVLCLAVSADGRLLASGGGDGVVRLWRLPDGTPLLPLKAHARPVVCATFSGSAERGARNAEWGDDPMAFEVPRTGPPSPSPVSELRVPRSAFRAPPGEVLATGSHDNTVQLWRVAATLPELAPLSRLPVRETTLAHLERVQAALGEERSPAERNALAFLEGLLRWRRRFDIGVEDAPARIPVGEFDIEIEG